MTLVYLLDTNVVSEPLRPAPDTQLLARVRAHQFEIAIPAVVWHELWYGCRLLPDSARRRTIEAYLREVVAPSMPVLPYDEAAAAWHAEERARLALLGQPHPFVDGQIAAVAATRGLTLVTLNQADFAGFQGLAIADGRQ